MHARVAVGAAVGAELLEVDAAEAVGRVEAGLLGQFAGRRLVQRLAAGLDEPAGKRPGALVRPTAATHQQYVQGTLAEGQRDDVDGHGDGLEGARVVGGQERVLTLPARHRAPLPAQLFSP